VLVRPARPEDAAAVAEVHVRTWQAAYEHVFGAERLAQLDLEQRRASWTERLSDPEPHRRTLVAEHDAGRVVGFAAVGASRDADGEGELYGIYVAPEAWGSGAGTALMHAAVASLREGGYPSATLWVLEDNPRARSFYEREGWALDDGRREGEHLGVRTLEVRYRITLD
jgi:ribosomal protein S18 acetylase RimI-like enzyme